MSRSMDELPNLSCMFFRREARSAYLDLGKPSRRAFTTVYMFPSCIHELDEVMRVLTCTIVPPVAPPVAVAPVCDLDGGFPTPFPFPPTTESV